MASFFEKLKKGMGVEISEEESEEIEEKIKPISKKIKLTPKKKGVKTLETKTELIEPEVEKIEKPEMPEIKKEEKEFALENLGGQEGQLAIDVYQIDGELVIQSAIAGVKPEELDISIEGDLVLIRGSREKPAEKEEINYFYQECYWGPFSRQIILPEEVDPSRAEATMKEGILTIRIPKIERKKKRKIIVKE